MDKRMKFVTFYNTTQIIYNFEFNYFVVKIQKFEISLTSSCVTEECVEPKEKKHLYSYMNILITILHQQYPMVAET